MRASFPSSPTGIQTILAEGQASLDANNLVAGIDFFNGVRFGNVGDVDGTFGIPFPGNLDSSLYLGLNENLAIFPGVLGLPINENDPAIQTTFNAGIVEIEYLRPEGGGGALFLQNAKKGNGLATEHQRTTDKRGATRMKKVVKRHKF